MMKWKSHVINWWQLRGLDQRRYSDSPLQRNCQAANCEVCQLLLRCPFSFRTASASKSPSQGTS